MTGDRFVGLALVQHVQLQAVDDVLARRVPVHLPEPVRQAVGPHAARPGPSPCMTSWARLTSSPGTAAEREMGDCSAGGLRSAEHVAPLTPYRAPPLMVLSRRPSAVVTACGPAWRRHGATAEDLIPATAAKLDSMGLHESKPPQAQQMNFLTTLESNRSSLIPWSPHVGPITRGAARRRRRRWRSATSRRCIRGSGRGLAGTNAIGTEQSLSPPPL
jgi:hypothetical protein